MQTRVTDYFLYRYRYSIGYTFIALLVLSVLFISSVYIPGALREGEIQSAIQSGALSIRDMTPEMVVNLPYHLLQRASISLLGVSTLSIKLPTVILGMLTAIGALLLIRTWFRANVAVLATILGITTTIFLFLAQDGTPNIMFSFLSVWILFTATYVTRQKMFGTLWKVIAGVFMAVSLYTPMGIYLVLALFATAFFHPHIRYIIKNFPKVKLGIAVFLGLASIVPLVYASIINRGVLLELLGIPENAGLIGQHIMTSLTQLFGYPWQASSYLIQPLFSITLTMLIVIGIYRLLTHHYTARSFVVIIWGLVVFPLIIINPDKLTFLFPLGLLMSSLGIATLISSWYKLFPRNPYARIAGLIPLTILVIGVMSSGIMRYMNAYQQNPVILSHYTTDFNLIDNIMEDYKATPETAHVVTSDRELPIYQLFSKYDKRQTVGSDLDTSKRLTIFTRAAYENNNPDLSIERIITNRFQHNSDRFYIYKTATK